MCRKAFIAFACLTASIGLTYGQKDRDYINEARALNQELEAALADSDVAALDRILATGYVEINTQGEMSDKGQLLANTRARQAVPSGVVVGPDRKVVEQTFRTQGNTAIVIHKISIRYPHMDYQTTGAAPAQAPQMVDEQMRIRVYSRAGDTWQLMAQQTTFIPKR